MRKYKLYLFDFDGTLFDTSRGLYYVFKEAFKVADVDIKKEDVTYLSRVPLSESYVKFGGNKDKISEFSKRILEALDEDESIETTIKFPEIDDLLALFKNNHIDVGIVTSNNKPHVLKILRYLNIDPALFKVIIGSDICDETKPSPKPILMALDNYQNKVLKSDVVYVGDSINDVLAAKNAGIEYFLLDRKKNSNAEFPRINNLMELFD